MTETGYFSSFPATEQYQHGRGKKVRRFHLFTIILKVEIAAHRGDNTSVRNTDICYIRKHMLCGLCTCYVAFSRLLPFSESHGHCVSDSG